MAKGDDPGADAALSSYAASTRLRVHTSADEPEMWAAAFTRGPGAHPLGGAVLIVNPNALPSRPEGYKTMLVSDKLPREAVDALIARAEEVFNRERETGISSAGWIYDQDGARTLLLSS